LVASRTSYEVSGLKKNKRGRPARIGVAGAALLRSALCDPIGLNLRQLFLCAGELRFQLMDLSVAIEQKDCESRRDDEEQCTHKESLRFPMGQGTSGFEGRPGIHSTSSRAEGPTGSHGQPLDGELALGFSIVRWNECDVDTELMKLPVHASGTVAAGSECCAEGKRL
jgi:hypothetical protein